MSEISSARHLLSQVNLVVQNHEKFQKETGNAFSFTHALDIESDEVRLHTRLIGYLINPKAGHFQGDKFLKLFFKAVDIKEDTDGFKIEIEKSIGKIDRDNEEGGRIDLLISHEKKRIGFAIEVKIYAAEQEKQLKRYSKYLTYNFKSEESKVYFLTLEGNESQYHQEFDKYEKISFREHIHKWIESCRLASVDQPIIRETLTQYLANIKRLTNQNPDKNMETELFEIVTTKDNIKAYFSLLELQQKVRQRMVINLAEDLITHFKGTRILKVEYSEKLGIAHSSIDFILQQESVRIRLYWLTNWGKVGIGIMCSEKLTPESKNLLRNSLNFLKLGAYRDFADWGWFMNIDELEGRPLLNEKDWNRFGSGFWKDKISNWVEQISDTYLEVKKKMENGI
ncbi:PD-(D/E)XK nuclease superfamily protein [Algoriphagus boseongensis]|uniref:PD-(D/E)XK nuclease superfamily protein n=1 Tax=Algoriphagus boseongensis TaxID=1442587 RepID=A0A4R6T626_9BACT|nr:PD-(D/E)XK nuclease family protein [Algoriphagus boseongensis]TDQ15206.1 PD-(D/E)XK nuclease superfamily protein [Algoriphagus boseongensis]